MLPPPVLPLECRRARNQCKTHQQPVVNAQGNPGSPASSGAFVSPLSSPIPHCDTPPVPFVPPVPAPSTLASTQDPQASQRLITDIPPPQPTQRHLAQPLGGAWLVHHNATAQQKEDIKNLKVLRLNVRGLPLRFRILYDFRTFHRFRHPLIFWKLLLQSS